MIEDSTNKNSNLGFRHKYGTLMAKVGFTQIPNILIENRSNLGLDTAELELILWLLFYEKDRCISYPSLKAISEKGSKKLEKRRAGGSRDTLGNAKKRLILKKYLRVTKNKKTGYSNNGHDNDIFDLAGLRRAMRGVARQRILLDKRISEAELNTFLRIDSNENFLFEDVTKFQA